MVKEISLEHLVHSLFTGWGTAEKQKLKRKFYSKQSLKTTPGLDVVGLVSDSPVLDAPVLSLKGNYHF